MKANEIIEKILNAKGQFTLAKWKSKVKTAAAYKDIDITKITTAVVRSGINFANISSVKKAIENGERGEIQPLSWGIWKKFPYVIEHKGKEYIRLYPSINHRPKVSYFINGVEVSKKDVAGYLTPAKAKELFEQKKPVECFTVTLTNILDITD